MTPLHPAISRLLAVAILIAFVALLHAGLWRSIETRFSDYDESIATSLAALKRYGERNLDLDALRQQRQLLNTSQMQQTGLLRGGNEAIAGAFMQQVITSAIRVESGNMRSVQILPVQDRDGLRKITARVQVNLTSAALRNLIYRIEASRPFLFVDSIDIRQMPSGSAQAASEQRPDLLVRLDVYGFQQIAAAPSQQS